MRALQRPRVKRREGGREREGERQNFANEFRFFFLSVSGFYVFISFVRRGSRLVDDHKTSMQTIPNLFPCGGENGGLEMACRNNHDNVENNKRPPRD